MMTTDSVAVLDLRECEFRTMAELATQLYDGMVMIRIDGVSKLAFACITENQNRWLQMEVYEQTKSLEKARKFRVSRVAETKIVIYEDDEGIPCPECERLH